MKTIPDETLTKIRDHLKTLKLARMEKALEKELSEAARKGSAPMDLLERLLSIEANALIERRIERRVRESKLPERKLLADFDFAFQTGLDKAQVMEIAKLDFVERKQGLVIAGNSGTGKKSHRESAPSSGMRPALPLSIYHRRRHAHRAHGEQGGQHTPHEAQGLHFPRHTPH